MLLMRQHIDGPGDNISITACSPGNKEVFLYLIRVCFWYASAAYQASFFGRVMIRILVRLRLVKIPMARPNEPDMLPKRTKKV